MQRYLTPYQQAGNKNQIFAKDTWGGAFHDDFQLQSGDALVKEHWGSSGFPKPLAAFISDRAHRFVAWS